MILILAFARNQILRKIADEVISIFELHFSFSFELIILKLSYDVILDDFQLAISMFFIVFESSFVKSLLLILEDALPIQLVIFEVSFINFSVFEYVLPPMNSIFFPFALDDVSVLEIQNSFSFPFHLHNRAIVARLTWIYYPPV